MSNEVYTPQEKMEQALLGNMDPKEAGIADLKDIPIIGQQQPDPKNLRALRGPGAPPAFGDKIEFQAGVVPLVLRAAWEEEEAKIIPFDKDGWMEKHKNEYRVQGMVACGNGVLRLDQTYNDPVLGLCAVMRAAADAIEQKYKEANEQTEPAIPG